jgi:hypothetical protein
LKSTYLRNGLGMCVHLRHPFRFSPIFTASHWCISTYYVFADNCPTDPLLSQCFQEPWALSAHFLPSTPPPALDYIIPSHLDLTGLFPLHLLDISHHSTVVFQSWDCQVSLHHSFSLFVPNSHFDVLPPSRPYILVYNGWERC